MTPREVATLEGLTQLRDLFTTKGHCRLSWAKDPCGIPTNEYDPGAAQYCLVGGLRSLRLDNHTDVYMALAEAVPVTEGDQSNLARLITFSDTCPDLVEWLDRVIATYRRNHP